MGGFNAFKPSLFVPGGIFDNRPVLKSNARQGSEKNLWISGILMGKDESLERVKLNFFFFSIKPDYVFIFIIGSIMIKHL